MCDINSIVDQFKSMASLDWSAMANHLTREVLVLSLDLPETLANITQLESIMTCDKMQEIFDQQIADAGQQGAKEDTTATNEEDFWDVFISDDVVEDIKQVITEDDLRNCIDGFDEWQIGQLVGELLTKVFSRQLKPLI